jgi:hypothetical protein
LFVGHYAVALLLRVKVAANGCNGERIFLVGWVRVMVHETRTMAGRNKKKDTIAASFF